MEKKSINRINISEESGFSLLEVMISLAILAVGLLGIAALQITAIKGNSSGMKMTEVSTLIGSKLEDYRQMDYANVITPDEPEIVKIHESDSSVYTRTTTVTNDTPDIGLKTVTVELSWTDTRPHSVSFMTIISNL
ncbi:prepilin-type N-terminal cleavage/methylation domain-containing protein [Desulfobacterales bacterium HSG17]|nr:prepilin-type N-terminal cleavage/methylation domain-containing protein [Desulfobacterales bacterium HSG17]